MNWLKEHGVCTNYWEYMELPERVLDDCRMFARAEAMAQRIAMHR